MSNLTEPAEIIMAIPDDQLAAALRALLRFPSGFYAGFSGMLEIGQLENLNYWIESRQIDGTVLWEADDISLDDAIGHFLRIRQERELGFDIETDLNSESENIG